MKNVKVILFAAVLAINSPLFAATTHTTTDTGTSVSAPTNNPVGVSGDINTSGRANNPNVGHQTMTGDTHTLKSDNGASVNAYAPTNPTGAISPTNPGMANPSTNTSTNSNTTVNPTADTNNLR